MTEYICNTDGNECRRMTAIEIIRCKDCTYARDTAKPDDEYQWLECTRHDMIGAECIIPVAPGGFCALGRRRADG